jgi:tetratricopeptide (TPR) repeat protein
MENKEKGDGETKMQRAIIEKGELELAQAHIFYDKKEYLQAIKYFQSALLYLDRVSAEIHPTHFQKRCFKALELIHKIWGCLGIIYRETGHNKESLECFKKEAYYAHLDRVYKKQYIELKKIQKVQKKLLLNDIFIITIIALILLISGYNFNLILNDQVMYVNFTFLLIDFTVFLLFLIKIRNSYEIRKEFRKEPIIFCPRLKKSLSEYSEKRQRLMDILYRNFISFTFAVIILSICFSIMFIRAILLGTPVVDDPISGTGFQAGYISFILIASFIELLLLHGNKALNRKEKKEE